MFFQMQIIFIVLPFNMAAVQNLYALWLDAHELSKFLQYSSSSW